MKNKFLIVVAIFVASLNMGAMVCADDSVENEETEIIAEEETDSAVGVAVRMTCDEVNARINELSAITEPTEENVAELKKLRTHKRNKCSSSAGGRRTANRAASLSVASIASQIAPVIVASASETQSEDAKAKQADMCERLPDTIMAQTDESVKKTLQDTYDTYCAGGKVASDEIIQMTLVVLGPKEVVPAETAEEKALREEQNLASGLCKDGTKPNKYGCCTGEKFKDLGNLQFACCPEDGGECYPPIGK